MSSIFLYTLRLLPLCVHCARPAVPSLGIASAFNMLFYGYCFEISMKRFLTWHILAHARCISAAIDCMLTFMWPVLLFYRSESGGTGCVKICVKLQKSRFTFRTCLKHFTFALRIHLANAIWQYSAGIRQEQTCRSKSLWVHSKSRPNLLKLSDEFELIQSRDWQNRNTKNIEIGTTLTIDTSHWGRR